jgi:signal transduction histidine kinase
VTRTLARIAIAGVASALLLLLGGAILERALLGSTPAEARLRVEREVREFFALRSQRLKESARQAAPIATVKRALEEDVAATRNLFAAVRAALPADGDTDAAVTVFNTNRKPVAWAGRPSEFGVDTLTGGEAWFMSEGALGLRLVYVAPLMDGSTRLGAVATEVGLPSTRDPQSRAASLTPTGSFRLPTRLADVRLELFAGAHTRPSNETFDVFTPMGQRLVTAAVSDADLAAGRDRWNDATRSLAWIMVAATVLLMAAPVLDWRGRARGPGRYVMAAAGVAALVVIGRILLRLASPADWSNAEVFSGSAYASPLWGDVSPFWGSFLTSPFDFLATVLAAGGIVAVAFFAVEAWRVHRWIRRRPVAPRLALFLLTQLAAGSAAAAVLVGHQLLIRDTIAHATLDLLHFSLHPWNNARVALQVGLVIAHTTAAALAVLILRAATIPWRMPRRSWALRIATIAAWLTPFLAWQFLERPLDPRQLVPVGAAAVVVFLALATTRLEGRYRHGSQAFRLMLLTLALIVPTVAFYPVVFQAAWDAKTQLVETRYASQPLNQRETVKALLGMSLDQIDDFPGLRQLLAANEAGGSGDPSTNRAFQVWQTTALAYLPLTSSVELYRANGTLVSRFAFNLPEDLTGTPRSEERGCDWDRFEETAPFFAEDRRILHAGRALCVNNDPSRVVGSIIVHAMLDYGNLPFIQSETPYIQLLRPQSGRTEGVSGRDIEFAVYGWSGIPLYSSNEDAWPLTDDAFTRAQPSRDPFWTRLRRGDAEFDVYLVNDRFGIYALGFPVVSPVGHLVNLAELTVLASLTYLILLVGSGLFGWLGGRLTTAPQLLREVRASFYRKLFLAFVAAVIFPVALLAFVTRQYVADEMRANVAQEAIRTASAARRVVEDLVGQRVSQQKIPIDDNLLVWISRLINQDVNIFAESRLVATSERTLFASGLLPTRLPAEVYEALTLRRQGAAVTRETVGPIDYIVAGTPVTETTLPAGTITVPLTSRELQIEDQIDTFDRTVLLAALLFMLAGSWVGYRNAERIADPVNRLTRATRRIARGDLDARVAATSSDELRRLVEDFNSMAAELKRQRAELERTHRLEAWAEMARQVAHEIKNPLTPIQLNAEHLRRVHADRGEPLGPVLQECVATILQQVTLLRQIASEFSSFASSPTARRASVDPAAMLGEIIEPYQRALADRIGFEIDIPAKLPRVWIDRTLAGRSITNIIENALHAMPGAGTLSVTAREEPGRVRIRVADTGVGMDAEALARAFEPYFSTKATGTGLGLPIAKRNVELSGGTISVASERGRGTTVDISLPVESRT